ncbi:unnamed protein product [Brachionus calyciflorus]|uniref:Uncharacterized protein n=1 Tax=Brachionus calyciflorus TaxID=104777 RepID=A0A813S7P2_9BILA|nr:unnamed protein product [Brachionus calyciflorus]
MNLGEFICNNCFMSAHTNSVITSQNELEPSDCVSTLNTHEAETGDNSFDFVKEQINYENLKPEKSPEKLDWKEFKEGDTILLNVSKSYASKKACIVCRNSKQKLKIIPENARTEIIKNIESKKWNSAKTIWVLNVLNLNSDEIGDYNLFESEYAYCFRYFTCYQYFYAYSDWKCGRKHNFEGETISFIKDKNQVNISIQKGICHYQNSESIIDIKCKGLDKKMKINNFEYVLVFCTVFLREVAGGHYISIFNINDSLHLVDDLWPKRTQKDIENYKISSAFYLK